MELLEYQAKRQLAKFGIPIPEGVLTDSFESTRQAIESFDNSVTLRPQLMTARGSSFTPPTNDDLASFVESIYTSDMTIRSVLVERSVAVARRIYTNFGADRRTGKLMLSVHAEIDEKILSEQVLVNPFIGLREYQTRDLASSISLPRPYWGQFAKILTATFECYIAIDATRIALNPLVITQTNQFTLLGAKITVDDAALQRQPDFDVLRAANKVETPAEQARRINIDYKQLSGRISCISNGHGLALATLDAIHQLGSGQVSTGSLMNIGKQIHTPKILAALQIALTDPTIELLLLNLFANIASTDALAFSLKNIFDHSPPQKPIVLRIAGLGAENERHLLKQANIQNMYIYAATNDAALHALTLLE